MNPTLSLCDVAACYQAYQAEFDHATARVFQHGRFILGPEVSALETRLQDYLGVQHAITCASGTDALRLALMALDIGPGDEVLTTPFSFFATVEAILHCGAKPVFADIHPHTFTLDPRRLETRITPRTKAILPVSLFGLPAAFDDIGKIAQAHHLPVVEDSAQSFGAGFHGKPSAQAVTLSCTSFFPTKPLGCFGDGGAVFTPDEALAERIRCMRVHGQYARHHHERIGLNSRLDTLQAAILLVKLDHFNDEQAVRRRIAQGYHEALSAQGIACPIEPAGYESAWANYSILVENRRAFIAKLEAAGIPTAVHYPMPLYRQKALAYLKENPADFPVCEEVCRKIVSLPMHPFLTTQQQDWIHKHV